VFGEDSPIVKEERIATIQTLSGAGALRVGLEFLFAFFKRDIYVSKPSWPIHQKMS
jgi:aspartate/tyrosine/aromatic aminotransferase